MHTIASLGAHFGSDAPVELQSVCVDRRRQWSRAGNVWHNAGIRSGLHMVSAPSRMMSRPFARGAKA